MFGDDIRTLDLKAFIPLAFMLNVAEEVPCPLRDYAQNECKNLIGLYNRIKVGSIKTAFSKGNQSMFVLL